MKEQMTYVAIDADDVGQSIGNAVLSDNATELTSISGKINSGVQIFSKWAEYNGGNIISSGSDEAVFQVPLKSIEELEDLKNKYQKETGFSVSIGIGEKISDAAKALIYAKINGKNQIVDYSPEIEEIMKQSISGNLDKEKSAQVLEGGVGDETEASDVDPEQLKEGLSTEEEHTDDEKEAEEIALDHLTEDPEYYSKLKEMESKDTPDSEEDLDIDGRPDMQEEHGKINPEEDDIDQDGDVEHEEAMASDSMEEGSYDDQGDFSDEYLEEDESEEDESEEDESEEDESEEDESEEDMEDEDLSDSIEAEMEDDAEDDADMEMEPEADMEMEMEPEADMEMEPEADMEMEPEADMEMEMEPEADMEMEPEADMEEEALDDESLKQAIFDSLQIFKQNKDLLLALSNENPELYNALVVSLQSMIEMAKELGYGQEGLDQMEDEDLNPEDFEVSENEESSNEEENIEKNENFYNLISKINNVKNLLDIKKKEDKKQMLLNLKEKLNKLKNKKSNSSNKMLSSKKKTPPKPKKVEAASFCSNSNQKMKTSGKDCRANEDKDSPVCVARKKMNCRGKNAEKGPAIKKSEKLKAFLEKKRKK
jgi:hypothetical protein